MRKKTLCVSQEVDVDCEYEIDFDDLLELVESCNFIEKRELLELLRYDNNSKENESILIADNLYDENKLKILKVAFKKYTLEELLEKLDIKNNEY